MQQSSLSPLKRPSSYISSFAITFALPEIVPGPKPSLLVAKGQNSGKAMWKNGRARHLWMRVRKGLY